MMPLQQFALPYRTLQPHDEICSYHNGKARDFQLVINNWPNWSKMTVDKVYWNVKVHTTFAQKLLIQKISIKVQSLVATNIYIAVPFWIAFHLPVKIFNETHFNSTNQVTMHYYTCPKSKLLVILNTGVSMKYFGKFDNYCKTLNN